MKLASHPNVLSCYCGFVVEVGHVIYTHMVYLNSTNLNLEI